MQYSCSFVCYLKIIVYFCTENKNYYIITIK